jgi:xanthine/uracil permease
VILLIIKFAKGFLQNMSVLAGITVGYLATIALGWTDFSGISQEPWIRIVLPLQFGLPTFSLVPCLIMCLVMTIVFIEATGMFLALGAMTGRTIAPQDVTRGLRADSLGTLIGGIFNTFPYVSYSQNIGLVGVTGVYSRWVCATGGMIMLALGLVPKLAFIVASVPQCVLGGAGFIMFGMVAATGIKILSGVDYIAQRNNVLIVAISIGFGMIPIVSPNFFRIMPAELKPIFGDAIIMTRSPRCCSTLTSTGPRPRRHARAPWWQPRRRSICRSKSGAPPRTPPRTGGPWNPFICWVVRRGQLGTRQPPRSAPS